MPITPTLPTERPTLDEDLSVLAWLQVTRDQLSPECTSHLCGALLEWSMTGDGQLWPDPVEPTPARTATTSSCWCRSRSG